MSSAFQQVQDLKVKLEEKVKEASDFLDSQPGHRISILQWIGNLHRRRQFLAQKMKEWKAAVKKDPSDTSLDQYPEFEQLIDLTVMDVIGNLQVIADEIERQEDQDRQASGSSLSQNQNRPSGKVIKLPNLDIPVFDGENTLKWFEFYDMFRSIVHENKTLDDITKFSYLVGKLRSKARDLVRGLEITESNYQVALKLLKDEYDDVDHAIEIHYMKLIQLPKAKNVKELRDTFNQIEMHLNCLYALSEDVSQKHYATIIQTKIPHNILASLNYKHGESSWTVKSLRQEVKGYLKAEKRASLTTLISQVSCDDDVYPSTVEGLVAGNRKPKCLYCGQEHYSDQCTKYEV